MDRAEPEDSKGSPVSVWGLAEVEGTRPMAIQLSLHAQQLGYGVGTQVSCTDPGLGVHGGR